MTAWEGLQTGLEFKILKNHRIEAGKLRHYAWASGDYNTIHFDEEAAHTMGLPGRIAHGLLQLGLMNTSLEELIEQIAVNTGAQCRLVQLEIKFVGMAVVGDEMSISAKVAGTTETSFTLHLFVYRNSDRSQLTCIGSALIVERQETQKTTELQGTADLQ